MERRAWLRGIWEMVKEMLCQKILTYHLSSSPLLLPDQFTGLSVIVTGATSGIGLCTARELALGGANVTIACRNTKAAREIARGWQQEAQGSVKLNVEVMALDLLSLSSVRSFAGEWEPRKKPLDVLINNAGILRMGEPQRFSSDGIEQHLQVNHVAPALLSLLLLPSLVRASSPRIINVNSVAHHCSVVDAEHWNLKVEDSRFSSIRAYGTSKLAQLMFLKILASKLLEKKASIQCIAVHPGIVTTNLVRQVPGFRKKSFWRFDPAQGARSVLFCATDDQVADNLVKGFAYYSSNCKPGKVSPQAGDMESCMGVWKKTLEISRVKLDYLEQVLDGASN
ncbi:dehydrogenase/reductase SDR family member FEY-like [Aristolochia californica]|uniref:dehydrogenase/reductase SDR family member FEY-like n=1 Tax=Aristolochia californica TaxID=171875 RepID=UPI0035E0C32B